MMTTRQWTYEKFGWNDLTSDQRKLFETIEMDLMPLGRDIRKLMEAELSNDQINKVFKGAEDISREKGLRTGFGKTINFPRDAMARVNRVLADFGKKLQDSTPVKNIDAKFDALKATLRAKLEKNPKGKQALAMVDALGNAAKSHPVWQSAIIGLLTALSGLALGPAAIPVIAALLKGATELIKGEKLSTAVGKGLYAGALGYISAQVASALMGYFEAVRIASITPVGPKELGITTISFSGQAPTTIDGMEWTKWFRISNVTVDPTMRGAISDTILQMGSGDLSAYDRLLALARKVASPEYASELTQKLAGATTEKISNDGFLASIRTIGKYVTAAAGGAGAAATDVRKEPTAESSRLSLPIMEGLWADLTLKFGAGNLMKAWTQAGRPTDSVEIAQMMADMGMEADDIEASMRAAGLSDDDVKQTMADLATAGGDEDVPFVSGFKAYDAEAKKIFKSKGREEFVKYWEGKLAELEKSSEEPKSADQTKMIGDLRTALKAGDLEAAKNALAGGDTISADTKKRLLGLLVTATNVPEDDRKALADIINRATIAEMGLFEEMSSVLNQNKLTWKDLGYRLVVRERRTNSVVLL
jgi:hypothetical protein